jgi:hypothetical protein
MAKVLKDRIALLVENELTKAVSTLKGSGYLPGQQTKKSSLVCNPDIMTMQLENPICIQVLDVRSSFTST